MSSHDPTIDPAVELRGRYAAALSHVENFLGQTGAAQKVSRKFGGLAIILLDLARGVIHPILRTPHPVSTRPEDREDIWVLRALAAVGVDCLSRAMAQSKAATEAARKYPKLSRLLRPGTQLDSCLLNWRSSLKKRTAKNKAAIHAFHDGLAVLAGRQIQQPEHFALIGHHMALCGIHRTGGFPLIAATAKSLEQSLLALQQRELPLPGAALPVMARAVEGLRAFVGRVHDRDGFTAADAAEAADIQRELEGLRQEVDVATGARRCRIAGGRRGSARRARRGARTRSRRVPPTPPRSRIPRRCSESARAAAVAANASADGAAAAPARPVHVLPRRPWSRGPAARARSRPPGGHPRRRRPAGAADLSRGSGRTLSAGRRAAARLARASPATSERARSCSARCTRSRAARGWPARCAWASSRT